LVIHLWFIYVLLWCKPLRTIRKKIETCGSLSGIYLKVFILMLVCLLALCSKLFHMLSCPLFVAIITSYPSPNTHTLSLFHVFHWASFWYFVKYLWQGSRYGGSKSWYNAPGFVWWVYPYPKYHDFKITGEEELQFQAFVTSTWDKSYWPALRSGRRAHVINGVGDLLGPWGRKGKFLS